MEKDSNLIQELIHYYEGDPKRIQHFMKVYAFASLIADCEDVDDNTKFILKTAAIIHDIGIKFCEEKYGSCEGKLQEKEGPIIARPLLAKLSYDPPVVDRVCEIIGRHHTFENIDGIDCQILIEADLLVNIYEENASFAAIESLCANVFKTQTGINICKTMYARKDKEFIPDPEEIAKRGADMEFSCTTLIETKDIPFNPSFRICCEDNACGKYGVNYTCPPICGTTDEMRDKVLNHKYAIVFQSIWETPDFDDMSAYNKGKNKHNAMLRKFISELEPVYSEKGGFMIAASGCSLCETCSYVLGEPCRFPDKAASCTSAYCIHVEKLAEICGMEYDCGPGLTAFFGLYVFG